MTPEQKKHEEEYNAAKRRYENAYAEKRRSENEIADIKNRRKQIINSINELTSENRRYISSRDDVSGSFDKNSEFDAGWSDSEQKLSAAASGFLAIGSTSISKPQDLNIVFGDKNTTTRNKMNDVFSNLKKVRDELNEKIEANEKKISGLNAEMEDGKNRERSLSSNISEQERIMRNASIEMASHKKYL